jgi:hypothetical protein
MEKFKEKIKEKVTILIERISDVEDRKLYSKVVIKPSER